MTNLTDIQLIELLEGVAEMESTVPSESELLKEAAKRIERFNKVITSANNALR